MTGKLFWSFASCIFVTCLTTAFVPFFRLRDQLLTWLDLTWIVNGVPCSIVAVDEPPPPQLNLFEIPHIDATFVPFQTSRPVAHLTWSDLTRFKAYFWHTHPRHFRTNFKKLIKILFTCFLKADLKKVEGKSSLRTDSIHGDGFQKADQKNFQNRRGGPLCQILITLITQLLAPELRPWSSAQNFKKLIKILFTCFLKADPKKVEGKSSLRTDSIHGDGFQKADQKNFQNFRSFSGNESDPVGSLEVVTSGSYSIFLQPPFLDHGFGFVLIDMICRNHQFHAAFVPFSDFATSCSLCACWHECCGYHQRTR